MEKFYLFGAGINCYSVIDFFGGENIRGIIDNDTSRHSQSISGIPIISIGEYLLEGNNADILVTPIYYAEEIISELRIKGINKVFKSPWMQNGFFRSPIDIIQYLKKIECAKFVFVEESPIAKTVIDIAEHYDLKIRTICLDKLDELEEDTCILLACIPEMKTLELIEKEYTHHLYLKLYENIDMKMNIKYKVLERFQGMHVGKRCFICGNGPSLSVDDLEQLRKSKEICFGVNNVYKCFERTEWRPQYYIIVDQEVLIENKANLKRTSGTTFIRYSHDVEGITENENVFVFRGLLQSSKADKFSNDIVEGCYNGFTVIYEAIQIANYMGFSEIYLLGVDMTKGHFYQEDGTKLRMHREGDIGNAIRCISYAGRILKKNGVFLGNATRNVWWNDVPRVNLDEINFHEI